MHVDNLVFSTIIFALLMITWSSPALPSCSNDWSHYSGSQSAKTNRILLLDFNWLDQNVITQVLTQHGRFRDTHRGQAVDDRLVYFASITTFINLVAETYNASLISTTGIPSNCILSSTDTLLSIHLISRHVRGKIATLNSNHAGVPFGLFPFIDDAFNFLYC